MKFAMRSDVFRVMLISEKQQGKIAALSGEQRPKKCAPLL
jgi:hypothetical protein